VEGKHARVRQAANVEGVIIGQLQEMQRVAVGIA
jgi:hypothetical protein